MAVFTLESLVLRGVSVAVCDEKAGELRRGTGYAGGPGAPEIQFSMRRQPSALACCADAEGWLRAPMVVQWANDLY